MMREIFKIMMILGIGVFMFMMFMALFIDFTKVEFAIPFVIGVVGYFGNSLYEREYRRGY